MYAVSRNRGLVSDVLLAAILIPLFSSQEQWPRWRPSCFLCSWAKTSGLVRGHLNFRCSYCSDFILWKVRWFSRLTRAFSCGWHFHWPYSLVCDLLLPSTTLHKCRRWLACEFSIPSVTECCHTYRIYCVLLVCVLANLTVQWVQHTVCWLYVTSWSSS